jgi:hypothetical protein
MTKWNTVTKSVDEETGEVTFSKSKSEDFVIVFNSVSDIIAVKCTPTEIKLLFSLFSLVEYNTGKLYITSKRRVELREKIGGEKILNNGSFSTAFKGLLDKKILLKSEGNFILSPYFFWKGELSLRTKLLKVVLKEQLNGKTS